MIRNRHDRSLQVVNDPSCRWRKKLMEISKILMRFPILIFLFLYPVHIFTQNFKRIETRSGLNAMIDCNGVAVADFDGDNYLDLFVVLRQDIGSLKSIRQGSLWRNENDGTFTNLEGLSAIKVDQDYSAIQINAQYGVTMSASWGDYNNDGAPDLLLGNVFNVRLFQNNGGTFTNITAEARLPIESTCHYVGATWWDYNNDGHLDIYFTKWLNCGSNQLFKNNGDGTFTDVTEISGITDPKDEDQSWMSIPIDANNDGLLDLYVTNDYAIPNRLYLNSKEGLFSEVASDFGLEDEDTDGMGITTGDYNNDGKFDLYITNINKSSQFENNGNNMFANRATELGTENSGWAWGTQFADFDNDGDEDLMIVNGFGSETENFYYKNLLKEGSSQFKNITSEVGLDHKSNANGLAVFDYDSDGDLDMVVSQTMKPLIFYENLVIDGKTDGEHNWLRIKPVGTTSNHNAVGAVMELATEEGSQFRFHHGANFLAQNIPFVHFGLGASNKIESLKIKWPSGLEEVHMDVPINKSISVTEGGNLSILNLSSAKVYGCTDPESCTYNPDATVDDGSCSYLDIYQITGKKVSSFQRQEIYSYPINSGSGYTWTVVGGEIIEGQGSGSITVKWNNESSGKISVREFNQCYSESVDLDIIITPTSEKSEFSIARLWNEALLEAIRKDYARPTVHARNLFHTGIAMYDSWAVFHPTHSTYLLGMQLHQYKNVFEGFKSNIDIEDAIPMALSYSVYRLLSHRFSESPHADATLEYFDVLMDELGYDKDFTSTDYTAGDPAALGNFIAETIITYGKQDGSREDYKYDNAYYKSVNPALAPALPGNTSIQNPNRWQPLRLDIFIDQSGNPVSGTIPEFLSPEWGNVSTFSLGQNDYMVKSRNDNSYRIYYDPGSPPFIDTLNPTSISDLYKWNFAMVLVWSAHLTPYDDILWDISPQSIGNIDYDKLPKYLLGHKNFYKFFEGGDIGLGRSVNPVTGMPYEAQLVPRGDYTRILAEFWADGPDSETPPGHWFVLLNYVNDHPLLVKKLEGKGEVLDDLEWDVKTYFILGGIMHDAAVAAWSIKGWYDYIRPISALRYMAQKGQCTDESMPNYDVAGIPLIEGYIEVVKEGDELARGNVDNIGKIKFYSWKGHSFINNINTDEAGVGWILAENWWPYQRPSFVTPPFAGYVSGHSTFSRAAAEAMTLITGDEYFPGGIGTFLAKKDEFLVFENGPSQDVTLQWATYRDASDQCSLSRIWGGIHPPADDIPGRLIGEAIGIQGFNYALEYFKGGKIHPEYSERETLAFPNPVNSGGSFIATNILPEEEFEFFDLTGKMISISKFKYLSNIKSIEIQLPPISSGIYFLKTKTKSLKIIVL